MALDYYAVLGVASDAQVEDIKRQYRLLVRENHPDVAPDKEVAHARMQLILEAWNVLGDPAERERYDRTLKSGGEYSGKAAKADNSTHAAQPPSEAVRKARVAQNMKNTTTGPKTGNPRTRWLTMVFEAQLQFFQGNVTQAADMANQVIKADPTNAEAAALLGDIHMKLGKEDVALLWFERAMRYQPGNLMYKQKWETLRQKAPAPEPVITASAQPAMGKSRARHPLMKKTPPPLPVGDPDAERPDNTAIHNIRDSVIASRAAAREAAAAEPQPDPTPTEPEKTPLFGKIGSWFKGGAKNEK